ncbi:MAG: hypothetical protein ACPG8W_08985 [Candidatus Promineifilaceae bacterium]
MEWLQQLVSRVGFLGLFVFMGVTLPPRPTPPQTPAVQQPAEVAGIILTVTSVSAENAGLWTQVQWLAGDGTWVTAEGWQGTLALDATQSSLLGVQHWAVGDTLYGQTNFRWQLLDMEGGTVIATSETFDLPGGEGQVVSVNMAAD